MTSEPTPDAETPGAPAFAAPARDAAFVTPAVLFLNVLLIATCGLVFFAIAFVVMVKVTPFSVRKEIEDDQNTALAIIMASVIIGIALIIGMAIQG